MSNKQTHWLQLSENHKHPYLIVPSSRAKYVRVKLSNKGELSVTLPEGVSVSQAHEFLKSRAQWVEKHLRKLPLEQMLSRPANLPLRLLDEDWQIDYQETQEQRVSLYESSINQLKVSGNVENLSLVLEVITRWCKLKSRRVLNEKLQQIAAEFGFHYKRVSIRAQKTRWGSCSSSKNINLNCKLLFMPVPVVRYVLIHELCHTREMNHSSRFWALVEECDPDYKKHRQQLRQIARKMPF